MTRRGEAGSAARDSITDALQASVVIPVYNEGDAVVACLSRILREVTLPCSAGLVAGDGRL